MNLYHGTNETQEFWESEGNGYVIIRCHEESVWSLHTKNDGNYRFLQFGTPETLAYAVNAKLNTTKNWKKINDKFVLQ